MDSGEPNLPEKIYGHPAHKHDLVFCHFQASDGIYWRICFADRCHRSIDDGDGMYVCEGCPSHHCIFKMHSACAGIKTQMGAGELDSSERIHNPAAHKHDLVLGHFQGIGDSYYCSLCKSNIKTGDEIYTCETSSRFDYCHFSAHKACCFIKAKMDAGALNLPKRIYRHPAHYEHELVLGQSTRSAKQRCDAYRCPNRHIINEGQEMYMCGHSGCFGCEFKMHSACAGIKDQTDAGEPDLSKRIHHPAHDHALVAVRRHHVGDSCCSFCENNYKEGYEVYTCETSSRFDYCRFSIHEVCRSIKAEVQMDVAEPDLPERIHGHPAHQDELVLSRFQPTGNVPFGTCSVYRCCIYLVEGDEIYACENGPSGCKFKMHIACAGVKAQMDASGSNFPNIVYGHPAHEGELVLKTESTYYGWCYVYHCSDRRIRKGGETYVCENCPRHGCKLKMHRACAGIKAQMDGPGEPDSSERIHHPAHDHALVLCHHQAIGDSSCSTCGNNFMDGDELYMCETSSRFDFCRFSIHKACSSIQAEVDAREANLPEMTTHPNHEGGLVLSLYSGCRIGQYIQNPTCSVCRIKRHKKGEEIYVCGNSSHIGCGFSMDIACSSIKANIHFRGHRKDHPLMFLEGISSDGRLECKSCKEELSNKPIFSCSLCEHRIHLLCGPLPIAIPYHFAGYDMNLILTDTFLDGVDSEDSWCDICEEMREPGKCVYRSEYPLFTAAIDCLLPQIVRALKGEFGEIHLRTVRGHLPAMVRPFTAQGSTKHKKFAELRTPLDDDAEEVIEESDVANKNAGTISYKQLEDSLTEEDWKHIVTCCLELSDFFDGGHALHFQFSDNAFKLFKEHVATRGEYTDGVMDFWLDNYSECVKVGDNYVASEFIPLYRQLIEKHGDFVADSPLSQKGRSWALVRFLATIKGMQGLQTHQTTADVLCTLQCIWESLICNAAGFSIQFALDNLEKVARACYALKLIKVRDRITRDLTQKIQGLEREIDEDKPQLEARRGQYLRAKKGSSFGKQNPLKVSKLQWKDAGEFLGLDPEE